MSLIKAKPRRGRGRPKGANNKPKPRTPGEEQHQVSINLAPPDWQAAKELAEKAGISTATLLGRLVRQELDGEPLELKPTAKSKLEILRRRLERQLHTEHAKRMAGLEAEIRHRVLAEAQEHLAYLSAERLEAKNTERLYREMINAHQLPFTADEFRLILMCLHPDGVRTPEKLAEAFRLFNGRKLQLASNR